MVKMVKLENNSKERIYKMFEKCCEDFTNHFNSTRELISQNLLKLRLSIVEKTVDDVITKFFEEGIKKLREDFKAKVEEVQIALNKDFNEQSANIKV